MGIKRGDGVAHKWLMDHISYPHDYCLIWPFSRDSRVGRGRISHNGCMYWAHRLMCELAHGKPPTRQHQAAHNCGKGHKGCVNPRHLSWKTNSENQLDRAVHGTVLRSFKQKFTPEKVAELRSLRGEMTQMALAERFDCSLGTVQYYLKYREQRGSEPTLVPADEPSCHGSAED